MNQMKKHTKPAKTQKSQKTLNRLDFFDKMVKKIEIFAFCAIPYKPMENQICLAHQNDCLNFSFVKDVDVHGKKMCRKIII